MKKEISDDDDDHRPNNPTLLNVIISSGDSQSQSQSHVVDDSIRKLNKTDDDGNNNDVKLTVEDLVKSCSVPVPLPDKAHLSSAASFHEQLCRVCQQEKEEVLIELGCKCRGSLAKAHLSCIGAWFRTRGSNKCEICQDIAVNVPAPESLPTVNTWVLRVDPSLESQDHRGRGFFSPLWVAFSILMGGLLLDVLISITLGVSALPINIIIGVIVVLGLGTALRLALEFFHEWSLRRAGQVVQTNIIHGYHPAL